MRRSSHIRRPWQQCPTESIALDSFSPHFQVVSCIPFSTSSSGSQYGAVFGSLPSSDRRRNGTSARPRQARVRRHHGSRHGQGSVRVLSARLFNAAASSRASFACARSTWLSSLVGAERCGPLRSLIETSWTFDVSVAGTLCHWSVVSSEALLDRSSLGTHKQVRSVRSKKWAPAAEGRRGRWSAPLNGPERRVSWPGSLAHRASRLTSLTVSDATPQPLQSSPAAVQSGSVLSRRVLV